MENDPLRSWNIFREKVWEPWICHLSRWYFDVSEKCTLYRTIPEHLCCDVYVSLCRYQRKTRKSREVLWWHFSVEMRQASFTKNLMKKLSICVWIRCTSYFLKRLQTDSLILIYWCFCLFVFDFESLQNLHTFWFIMPPPRREGGIITCRGVRPSICLSCAST